MQIHVVSSGETLFSIARQYDVPAGILARYNGLAEPYRLAVGQSLLILRPTSLVTVRAGDTLSSLARQNGQSVRSLLRLNPNLTQQTAIYPGQIVVTAIEDAPELKLDSLCGIWEQPNGNLVVGTWANGAPDATRATAFEVTRDKRIVWAHFPAQDRNMMTVQRPPLK